MSTRKQQVDDKNQERQDQRSEDWQWAVQNYANTQHLLNNEIELKDKQSNMKNDLRDTHLDQKDAKDARWPNMYGDLNPLPDVTKDMVAGADPRPLK